ncbi:MAG: hypothetical protein JXL80_03730 [Planctomycetes bacterium]|nr:hypothetical protein [Planctomycetota bacterium]
MGTAADDIRTISRYILKPDANGAHLREMAEAMAAHGLRSANVPLEDRDEAMQSQLAKAAETIAAFAVLAWGGAGTAEYARRTQLMLGALRDRMRGMNPEMTRQYAIEALNADIEFRLRRAEHLVLDSRAEKELIDHFFDDDPQYDYLHDLVRNTMHLHWERRHSLAAAASCEPGKTNVLMGPRGDSALETHLRRAATEAVATYIEQANIAWGMVENLTDTGIVLRDRINIQRELGSIDEKTWEASGWKLADFIEGRFGTREGRKEARLARAGWRQLARRKLVH